MRITQAGWWHQPNRGGEGFAFYVNHDGGVAGFFFTPGAWYILGNFSENAHTRALEFGIGVQPGIDQAATVVGSGKIRAAGAGLSIEWTIGGQFRIGAFERLMPAAAAVPVDPPPPFPPPPEPPEPPPWQGWTDSPGRLNPVLMDFQTIWGSPYLQVGPRVAIPIQKSVTLLESVFDVACIRCVAPPADAPQKFGSFNHDLDSGSCFMWWSTRPADLLEFDGTPGWAAADQIGWQLNTLSGRDHFPMEPGGVYYLNIAFFQGFPVGTPGTPDHWKGAVQLLREGNPVFLRDAGLQPAQEYTGTNTYWGASQRA